MAEKEPIAGGYREELRYGDGEDSWVGRAKKRLRERKKMGEGEGFPKPDVRREDHGPEYTDNYMGLRGIQHRVKKPQDKGE